MDDDAKDARIAELEAKNADLAKRAIDATFWANQTGDKLSAARSAIEALRNLTETYEDRLGHAHNTVDAMEDEIEALRKRVGELNAEIGEMIADHNVMKARAEQAEAHVKELEADYAAVCNSNTAWKHRFREAMARAEQAEAELSTARAEIEALRKRVECEQLDREIAEKDCREARASRDWQLNKAAGLLARAEQAEARIANIAAVHKKESDDWQILSAKTMKQRDDAIHRYEQAEAQLAFVKGQKALVDGTIDAQQRQIEIQLAELAKAKFALSEMEAEAKLAAEERGRLNSRLKDGGISGF
jgi:chromosome segregation ATPase